MNWGEPIDLYCERTDAGLWSEPFNALSNLGFLLARRGEHAEAEQSMQAAAALHRRIPN